MSEVTQSGWTRLRTPTGRFEYQFQGEGPAVRQGKYRNARDYNFLVMDDERMLYRIPVCISDAALATMPDAGTKLCVAARQLRFGLNSYQPRANAPYEELDSLFAVDARRAEELLRHT
ncbi:MAG: hypothetical protein WA871_14035, partial [Candidatus Acidiferrales bacterium]